MAVQIYSLAQRGFYALTLLFALTAVGCSGCGLHRWKSRCVCIKQSTFTVTLSKGSGQAVSVNYDTANGTAIAGSDYTGQSGALTFAPGGSRTQAVSITIVGDATVENDETLYVFLSSAANASISKARGVGTNTNDDVSG